MNRFLRLKIIAVGTLASVFLLNTSAFADYTATGRFQYENREFNIDGFTGIITPRPIRFADVRIMAGSDTLVTGATNSNGEFSVSVPGSTPQFITAVCVGTATMTPGLLLDVRVANDNFSFGDFYSVASEGVDASGSGTVDLGTTIAPSNIDSGKAFNIWDVVSDGFEFLASSDVNNSLPTVRLTVIWRRTHTRTGSFYCGSGKFIYTGVNAAYNDTVISHEFGHYVDDVFSNSDSPGGTHFIGDNKQDIRLSWSEGLATFIGSSIRKFKGYARPDVYVNTDGVNLSFSYEIESLGGNSIFLSSKTGSTNEIAVTAALWDITDGLDDGDATPEIDDDPLQLPFSEVWEDLTQYLTTIPSSDISIEDFWDGWFSPIVDNGFLEEMQTVFTTLNGIEFIEDAEEPDNDKETAARVTAVQIPALAEGPLVIINELDLGRNDAVELYNAGHIEADLRGWIVMATGVDSAETTLILPAFRLDPGAFVILSEDSGTDSDTELFFGSNISWANDEGGACVLVDNSGRSKDFIRWGDSPEPIPADTLLTEVNPPSPPSDKTLARSFPCADTDSGCDWSPQDPTLGTYNHTQQDTHHTYFGVGDVDFAVFNASAGGRYVVESLNPRNGAVVIIDLLSNDGTTVLASTEDLGLGEPVRLVWTATSTEQIFIRSRRLDGSRNHAQYGSYELRLIETSSPLPLLTSVLPQIAAGGDYSTSIFILNSGARHAAVVMELRDSAGLPFPWLEGRGSEGVFNLCIQPGGTYRLEVSSLMDTVSGFSKLSSNVPINASALFRTFRQDSVISQAAVGLSKPTKRFIVYIDNLGDALSGYAVANIGVDTATLTMTLRNREGTMLWTRNLQIPPGQHIAEFAHERFPGVASSGFEGSIEVESDVEVTSVALRFDNITHDVFSTIPVLVDEASTTLYFPQLADGDGYRTNFILMNPSDSAAAATMEFFSSEGTPLSLVIDGISRTNLDVRLPRKGVVRFVTDGTSVGIKVGWVRVTGDIAIGGSSIFQTLEGSRITSQAGVASSPLALNLLSYVNSIGFAESGLAICNPNGVEVTLSLRLRNSAGEVVATKSTSLPPLGHFAKFFTEWFPNGFDQFEGTLEVRSTHEVSGVALRFDNVFADVFATLPVVVKP